MSIITISRGSYSGGKALAECLAGCLGYRLIDRETVIANAALCGASEEKLRGAIVNPPGFWDHFKEEKRRYMVFFQACLAEEARQDGLIYLGNAGHLLLGGIGHVLRVRAIAPMAARLRIVQENLHLNHEDALAYIEKRDQDRAKWTHYLYGVDWSDPALYDLVINLERATVEEACATVTAMAKEPSFQATAESSEAMDNLALCSRIHAMLLKHPETKELLLDVEARKGSVVLHGKVRNRKQWDEVEQIVRQTPGVEHLAMDDLVQVLDS